MRLIGLAVVLIVSLILAVPGPEAQQVGRVWRMGVLSTVHAPALEDAFRQGLQERGYVEGRNLVLEWRFSEGRDERFAAFAAEFVRLKVDLITTVTNAGAQAAKSATNTIPIVMGSSVSPERIGLIASLARPADNVTGLTLNTGPEIAGKLLQLLKEVVPRVSRVAVIRAAGATSGWFTESGTPVREIDAAAQGLGLTLEPVVVLRPDDVVSVFAAVTAARAEALLVELSGLAYVHRRLILEYAAKQRLPAMYPYKEFADDGGLMAYGVDLKDLYRRAAGYVDISKCVGRVNCSRVLAG